MHLTLATGINGPARTFVSNPDSRPVGGGAIPPGLELGIYASAGCVGVEVTCVVPAAPLAGEDGTTFVVGSHPSGTTAVAVSLSGKIMAGWPYLSDAGHQLPAAKPT